MKDFAIYATGEIVKILSPDEYDVYDLISESVFERFSKIEFLEETDDERMPVNRLQHVAAAEELLARRLVHGAAAQQPAQRKRLAFLVGRRPYLRRATAVDEFVERIRPKKMGCVRVVDRRLRFPAEQSQW